MTRIGSIWADIRGVGAIEYALVASLISIAAVAAVGNLGDKINSSYLQTNSALAEAL